MFRSTTLPLRCALARRQSTSLRYMVKERTPSPDSSRLSMRKRADSYPPTSSDLAEFEDTSMEWWNLLAKTGMCKLSSAAGDTSRSYVSATSISEPLESGRQPILLSKDLQPISSRLR